MKIKILKGYFNQQTNYQKGEFNHIIKKIIITYVEEIFALKFTNNEN